MGGIRGMSKLEAGLAFSSYLGSFANARLEDHPRPFCAGILLLKRIAVTDIQVSALGKAKL